ncbi:regulator of chromosome condensation RCC1 repeat protein [Nitzschia inconspicua]|uniref:Regulator of chromosome condensation RCC1 repeat protein n=1 Tax=Nitzschia inconspicua TaxID=303405 RepID=A0A9K3M1T0_9STRA|nr:regulator of chromosome condensation RCC1 repeat protein [Nitzschia inconspicua]
MNRLPSLVGNCHHRWGIPLLWSRRRLGGCCRQFFPLSIIHPNFDDTTRRRSFAVYAVGEGWTGAMTQQYLQASVPGHFDEDPLLLQETNVTVTTTSNQQQQQQQQQQQYQRPVVIYPYDDIQQVAVGWGTTALINTQGRVQLVGRPHDVMTLLRLNRMPTMIRNWIVAQDMNDAVTPVGSAISYLIGWATGENDNKDTSPSSSSSTSSSSDGSINTKNTSDWEHAKKYSFLSDWTYLEGNPLMTKQRIHKIACGPGFLAMLEKDGGTLYCMGVNNRGQCGVGTISNNVWTPQPVRGLTRNQKQMTRDDATVLLPTEQDEPMIQVALGFQHGYALSQKGHVYSWGKAQRGQLGRKVDLDQDPWAGPIPMDERVIQISAGHHHGALLTEQGTVYVWGKNMGRDNNNNSNNDHNNNNNKPVVGDALQPEQVLGLPTNIKVQQISCGSHHTAMLLQDGSVYAMGIASDEAVPILEAVELIPPGILELPLRQFEAHFDRTTVIDKSGTVLQAHLWLDERLREYAYFTPSYVDTLLDEHNDDFNSTNTNPVGKIRSIHRGWKHTVIVTDK